MTPTGKSDKLQKASGSPSLKEQAHQEILDLFKVAEESSHPAIRAAAIQMAKDKSRFAQKQQARLSPTLLLSVIIVLGVATISACWYAFLWQPRLAPELSGLSVLLFIVIATIILFLNGQLSQANLMKVFGWAVSHIKGWFSLTKSSDISSKK